MEYHKICEHCGKQFIAKRKDKKYCNSSCRVLACYKRNIEHNENSRGKYYY